MDRITRITIENVRAVQFAQLDFSSGLTVLIGENGAGKSTIVECLELLHKAGRPGFLQQFYATHRGLPSLLLKGAHSMALAIRFSSEDDGGVETEYRLEILQLANSAVAFTEELLEWAAGHENAKATMLKRNVSGVEVLHTQKAELVMVRGFGIRGDELAIHGFQTDPPNRAIPRLLRVLAGIEVQVPFDTRASWVARTHQRVESLRVASTLFPATRVQLSGVNLANAWSELLNRGEESRRQSLELVRLGLGDRVDSVVQQIDPGGGNVHLGVLFRGMSEPVLAGDLSDGQLSWLAFVAMVELNAGRSMLALDEPELHLHPYLLAALMALLQRVNVPILLSTHSDSLLSLVDDPADAVRVCELDDESRVQIRTVDRLLLAQWLQHYGDFGRLREAGYLSRVMTMREGA